MKDQALLKPLRGIDHFVLVIQIRRVDTNEENLVLVYSKKRRRNEERLYFPKLLKKIVKNKMLHGIYLRTATTRTTLLSKY